MIALRVRWRSVINSDTSIHHLLEDRREVLDDLVLDCGGRTSPDFFGWYGITPRIVRPMKSVRSMRARLAWSGTFVEARSGWSPIVECAASGDPGKPRA